jgi:2-polyprenyl-3-methyl-5-hydroxy-6-metoxy-1,4-benzoquinol methylase
MGTEGGAPSLDALRAHVVARWPEHADYVAKSLDGREPAVAAVSEELARIVLTLGADAEGGVDGLIDDYRFLCEVIVLPEELYFRRHGTYRLSRFADAERECYANADYMNRYMNGVLVSNVLWSNHAHAFAAYVNAFLPRLAAGGAHLEIGPGHGIFLAFAARRSDLSRIEGWDVSPTSIANTRAVLDALGVGGRVRLKLADVLHAAADEAPGGFDTIVISEVLEHLEDPLTALRAVARHLKPGGEIWINVPANSPMPDHIYLFHGPEDARALVEQAGLEVVETAAFPMSGHSLEKAMKRKLVVSCVVVARKPGQPAMAN